MREIEGCVILTRDAIMEMIGEIKRSESAVMFRKLEKIAKQDCRSRVSQKLKNDIAKHRKLGNNNAADALTEFRQWFMKETD